MTHVPERAERMGVTPLRDDGNATVMTIEPQPLPVDLVQWGDAGSRIPPSETGAVIPNLVIGGKLALAGSAIILATFTPGIPRILKWGGRAVGSLVLVGGLLDIGEETLKELGFRANL